MAPAWVWKQQHSLSLQVLTQLARTNAKLLQLTNQFDRPREVNLIANSIHESIIGLQYKIITDVAHDIAL